MQDPLAEKTYGWSPYNYVLGNPMNMIDPDERLAKPDDYFNKEGTYLGSDNSQTDFVKIVDQSDWDANKTVNENGEESIDPNVGNSISTDFSEADMTESGALAVYDHYNPMNVDLVAHDNENGSAGMSLNTKSVNGEIIQKIKVRIEGNKSTKLSDHFNEIKNVFSHEQRHYNDIKAYGIDGQIATSKNVREQRAVTTQMKHPTFKKTRPSFQQATKNYGAKHGLLFPMTPISPNSIK